MVSLVALGAISVGGAALAQSDVIVDPWARFTAAKQPLPQTDAPPPSLAREPWKPVAQEQLVDPFRPSVVPVGPVPAAPAPAVAPLPLSTVQPGDRPVPPRVAGGDWARVAVEIVDPWAPRRVAMFTDPVIVDPWAR